MRFFASASALLAMATAAVAQTPDFDSISRPATGDDVVAGSAFTVTWEAPAKYDGTISIHLIGGASQGTLQPVADIASGVQNSAETFSWTVGADLGTAALYGLVFKLESDPSVFQYSQPFTIKPSSNEGSEEGSDEGSDEGSEEGNGEGVVIITTAIGTKTVTLTSCPPTETTAVPTISVPLNTTSIETTTFVPPPPTSTLITTTKYENTTAPVVPTLPPTLPPTIIEPPIPTTAVPSPPPVNTPGVPESGAARFGSALFAVVGGVAAALLL
jgi:hypothetical protein